MATNLVRQMSEGFRLYRVGLEEPKTTILVSPDGENSEQISQQAFEHATGRNPLSPAVIEPYDYSVEGRVEYVLKPRVNSKLAQWVEIPLSGEMTICGDSKEGNSDPRPEHQQQHVHLERLPARQ